MANSGLKLYYWNGRGRAEAARIILHAAGKEFEDIKFSDEEWPKYKPLAPFGQGPFVEFNGKRYGQSVAIKNYLAREFGFYGKTNLDALKIDQVMQTIEDLTNICLKALFIENEEEKQKAIEKTKADSSPTFLGHFERLLAENKTNYFVGDGITLADIALLDVECGMLAPCVDINDSYPLLQKNLQLVRANSRIGAYLASRPDTPF